MNEEERGRDTLDDAVDARNTAAKEPRGSRGYQIGTLAVLAAAVGLVVASAVPALARELGVTEVRVVTRDFARSSSAGQVGMDAVRDFEKGIGRSVAELDIDDGDDALPEVARGVHAESRAKMAIAARDVVLREDPKRSSPVVGSAKRGQSLVLLREERGWYMVVQQTEDGGIEVGWVTERDVETPR